MPHIHGQAGSNPTAIDLPCFQVVGNTPVAFQKVLWHTHVGNQEVLPQCPKNPTSCKEL